MSVAQLRRALNDLADVPESAIREAATLVEGIAAQTGLPVTIRGKRYALTATTKFERSGESVINATVYGKPTGFWVWQNTGTKAHKIAPKPGTRRGLPRVIVGANWAHPVSVPVSHPGASGRGRWRQVQQRARREVPQVFRDAVADALKAVA